MAMIAVARKKSQSVLRSLALAAVVALGGQAPLVSAASAQSGWEPTEPIEIVIPSAAGGGTDRTGRAIQRILDDLKASPVPLVVVNKAGAGGTLGYSYVMQQHAGEGTYVAVTQPSLVTNKLLGNGDIDYTDGTPLANLLDEYIAFAVRTDSDIKTTDDFLNRMRENPEALVFGVSSALGQPGHIALALVLKAAGVDVTKLKIVVYGQGGGALRPALLGGHVDAITSTVANLVESLEAGQMRALAVAAPERVAGVYADVPTWKELGIDAVVSNWRGIIGPANMTPEQIAWWDNAFKMLVETDAWKQEAAENVSTIQYLNSAETTAFLEKESAQLEGILTELGLAIPAN